MRKIEKEMVQAVETRTDWHTANTRVTVDRQSGLVTVKLHNHPIYRLSATGKHYVSLAGWSSSTTRSRLRALGFCVVSKDFAPHINGAQVDASVWYVLRHKGDTPAYVENSDVPC